MAAPRIFISYRRDDTSGHAGRLFDRLVEHFRREQVFRDLDTIAAGEDFAEALRKKIAASDVLLVLIGPRWLAATDDEGRWRMADENDWVRVEIESALERNIRTIPLLVQGAVMPRAKDLPGALAKLAQLNAVEIRDASFDQDVRALLDLLGPTWRHRLLRRPIYPVSATALIVVLCVWIYLSFALTPDRARVGLGQMGLRYDDSSFIQSALKNDVQAVRLFLAAGMSANSEIGSTALRQAAGKQNLEVVKLLFERGARSDGALAQAVDTADNRAVFNYLLAQEPSREALNQALRRAAANPHTDLLPVLLDSGADVNSRTEERSGSSHTALHAAARWRRVDNARLLIARGADVNAADGEGLGVVHEAITADRYASGPVEQTIAILEMLVKKGADVDAPWRNSRDWHLTPLLLAIHDRKPEVALWLLEHGADASVWALAGGHAARRDRDALMLASEEGLADVVRVLLAKGVPVGTRNARGETALVAASNRVPGADDETVRVLLAAGADANEHDNDRRTPLMLAAGDRHTSAETLRALLAAGAGVNASDKHGWTPLMYAAQAGSVESVRTLLGANASASLKTKDGRDALTIATQEKRTAVVKLLSDHAVARGPARVKKPVTAAK